VINWRQQTRGSSARLWAARLLTIRLIAWFGVAYPITKSGFLFAVPEKTKFLSLCEAVWSFRFSVGVGGYRRQLTASSIRRQAGFSFLTWEDVTPRASKIALGASRGRPIRLPDMRFDASVDVTSEVLDLPQELAELGATYARWGGPFMSGSM